MGAIGNKSDKSAALNWMLVAADAGYVPAMTDLGIAYLQGDVVEKNYTKGRELLESVAHIGKPRIENALGVVYRDGLNVPPDLQKAAGHFKILPSSVYRKAIVITP